MEFIRKLRAFQAPSNFIFIDPDTQYEYKEASKEALIQRIEAYREQNRLEPIPELLMVLENYWCSLPENFGKCEGIKLNRDWFQYKKGAIQLIERVFFGEDKMVPQEIADARSEICASCKHNTFPDKTFFVKFSDKLADASTRGLKSKRHKDLGNCDVCTCSMRSKVFYKGPFKLSKKEREEMNKVGCWQPAEEAPNVD